MMFTGLYNISNFTKRDSGFSASISFNIEHYIFKAHFPGNPITPGVCLLQIIQELTEKYSGLKLTLSKAVNVKYLKIVKPQSEYLFNCDYIKSDGFINVNCTILSESEIYTKVSVKYTCVQDEFDKLGLTLLVPVYNNAAKIEEVIKSLIVRTHRIIVVNDGSTDGTLEILNKFSGSIEIISYQRNRGKGYALRQGFKRAIERGDNYIISLDGDGQHKADDLDKFIAALHNSPRSIIIGGRPVSQENKSAGSVFANKFANFWYKVQTGSTCSDTQSGYRLYPVEAIKKMHLLTNRYEFELEVLVKAAWKNINIETIPISVYYPPKEESMSHFRPFADFGRVSLLNTFLVFAAVVYGYPNKLIRKIF